MDAGRSWGKHAFQMANPKQKRRLLLRKWRKHRDLTQERLAEIAGVTQGMISQLENEQSDYTGELLEKLATALKCEPADLIARDPLDPEAPWTVWDRIGHEHRPLAIRLLQQLADGAAR